MFNSRILEAGEHFTLGIRGECHPWEARGTDENVLSIFIGTCELLIGLILSSCQLNYWCRLSSGAGLGGTAWGALGEWSPLMVIMTMCKFLLHLPAALTDPQHCWGLDISIKSCPYCFGFQLFLKCVCALMMMMKSMLNYVAHFWPTSQLEDWRIEQQSSSQLSPHH